MVTVQKDILRYITREEKIDCVILVDYCYEGRSELILILVLR